MTRTDALVVDADVGIRLALRAVLEDVGYVVSEATTGCETVTYLLTNPDALLVLLDVSLPRPDDLVLLQWIFTGEPPTARHSFVLLSTDPVRSLGTACDLAFACGVPVVAKPFDIDDLLDAVTYSIGHNRGVAIDAVPVTRHMQWSCNEMT